MYVGDGAYSKGRQPGNEKHHGVEAVTYKRSDAQYWKAIVLQSAWSKEADSKILRCLPSLASTCWKRHERK